MPKTMKNGTNNVRTGDGEPLSFGSGKNIDEQNKIILEACFLHLIHLSTE